MLESHKSGYVDLHDLDEARQPCKLYIDPPKRKGTCFGMNCTSFPVIRWPGRD
ncbi:hypothetical protein [Paenibacillus uliginis]|uniref:hypothetical protein n=1 Tax=Paenibacillus uliginis TaxID=683737 RepID=UPI001FCCFA96|nr:hypothetical protein [Paenibacillus uliginis]